MDPCGQDPTGGPTGGGTSTPFFRNRARHPYTSFLFAIPSLLSLNCLHIETNHREHNSLTNLLLQRSFTAVIYMISETILSFQGKSLPLTGIITPETPCRELYQRTFQALGLSPSTTTLKLLAKGKRLPDDDTTCGSVLPLFVEQHEQEQHQPWKKPLKLIVMATAIGVVTQLATKRSDPTIRGFEQQTQSNKNWEHR